MSEKESGVCPNHPNKKAMHTCKKCGKEICFECVSVSFGVYVCDECDPDLKQSGEDKEPAGSAKGPHTPKPPPGRIAALLQNPKALKGILALSAFLFLITVFFLYDIIKNPPHGKLSAYRVAFYPVKSEGKSITELLEEKGIRVEWKFLENKLTPDQGYFVYFADPKAHGLKPIWYVKDERAFTINKDSRDLCNSEISETALFSKTGLTEEDIYNYIYGQRR